MYYRIQYNSAGCSKRTGLKQKWLARIGLGMLGVCVFAGILWSSNANWAVTVGAMEEMAGTLEQGGNFADAISTFCLEILEGV